MIGATRKKTAREPRAKRFAQIAASLNGTVTYRDDGALVAEGDSLELLKTIPSKSVSLIVTDPPYHSTKKANILGDRNFGHDDEYLEWISRFAVEWHRVLRPSGSLYLFCAAEMSARLEVEIGKLLQPLSHITWTKPNDPGFDGWKGKMQKEALRRWYPHSERILFFSQALDGHVRRSPLGSFLREARMTAEVSGHELTEIIGAYGKVNHGGAVSNWETGRNVPSRDQYSRIKAALEATGKVVELPDYEDVVRPFNVSRDVPFTDVWEFPSVRVYRGKHPAEKPLVLLEHILHASSLPGDVVLDCFAGSGVTLEAAARLGRRGVGIELDPRWVSRSAERIRHARQEAPAALNGVTGLRSRDAPQVAPRDSTVALF